MLHGNILEMFGDITAYCYLFLTRSLNFITSCKKKIFFLYQLKPFHHNPTGEKKNPIMDTFLNFQECKIIEDLQMTPLAKFIIVTQTILIFNSFLSTKEPLNLQEKK